MIKKNLAAAILCVTMLVFRAHASDIFPFPDRFSDDVHKVIVSHMDLQNLYQFTLVSTGSIVLVQQELQKRVSNLIEKLYKLPLDTSGVNLLRDGGFYRTPSRKKENQQPGESCASFHYKLPMNWDYQKFQSEFKELFLLKEMELFRRHTLPLEFQDLFVYVKPMISMAKLPSSSKDSLYLGVQAAYILLTKPQVVASPSIDAFYLRKKDHQRTYLTPQTVKIIENICTLSLSQKTFDQIFEMCEGMIATTMMLQSPLSFGDVRKAGRALIKINLGIHYPAAVHEAFMEGIVSDEIIVYQNDKPFFTKMGNNPPRTGDEKRADFELLYQVQTHQYIPYIDDPIFSNAKVSKMLNDYELIFVFDEEAERFKQSPDIEKLFQ